jgi:hypothetical protein
MAFFTRCNLKQEWSISVARAEQGGSVLLRVSSVLGRTTVKLFLMLNLQNLWFLLLIKTTNST